MRFLYYNYLFLALSIELGSGTTCVSSSSSLSLLCDPAKNPLLYPSSFLVFSAYEGQVFSVGQVLLIAAKFPDIVCGLPQPIEASPTCKPLLKVGVYREDGGNCLEIPAAPDAKQIERDYGVSFRSDSSLDSPDGKYKFWVFPLPIVKGLFTSQLQIRGLLIPQDCNTITYFTNLDLIPKVNSLLSPNVGIDGLPPRIVNVYSGKPSGSYTAGEVINIIIEFSKDVYFSELPSKYSDAFRIANASYTLPFGLPFLELNSQSYATLEGYAAEIQNRRKLSFLYTVSTGEFTPEGGQLEVSPGTTIQLNGANIVSLATGMQADLTSMPASGTIAAEIDVDDLKIAGQINSTLDFFLTVDPPAIGLTPAGFLCTALSSPAGSMTSPGSPTIVITKTGEKFPPHGYDPNAPPGSVVVNTTRRNGQVFRTRRAGSPIKVSVNLQLNAIFDVVEKSQGLRADFVLQYSWKDPALSNPKKPNVTEYGADAFDKGLLWGPRLTFTNRRDLSNPSEGIVRVTNKGDVTVIQRFIAAYAVSLNIRDFPFDSQRFVWYVRSQAFNKDLVVFQPASNETCANASVLVSGVLDPTFAFSDYRQATYTIQGGIFNNFHVLAVSIKASRIATMSSIFLIFPLCLVCVALVLVLSQDPAKDMRLAVPTTCLTATMAFSFVVNNMCPPVSYVTRIHLLIFQTYVFAVVDLCVNYFCWEVEYGRKELTALNNANKNLLNDAHWMPRKIKPPPTNVVVLPEGVYAPKPEEKKQEEKKPEEKKPETLSAQLTFAPGSAKEAGKAPGAGDKAAAEPAKPPAKSTETGAFTDAKGEFKDVNDLLASDEVKTFKKLRWGGGPVKVFYGLAEVNNGNAQAWKDLVKQVDRLFKMVYPVCIAISVGCILGVRDLAGLPNPPMPLIGLPDPV